jgi:high-affinity Fe2+/Pb2+ permease
MSVMVVGFWLLAFGYWLLVIGFWLLRRIIFQTPIPDIFNSSARLRIALPLRGNAQSDYAESTPSWQKSSTSIFPPVGM